MVGFWRSYSKNKTGTFFETQCSFYLGSVAYLGDQLCEPPWPDSRDFFKDELSRLRTAFSFTHCLATHLSASDSFSTMALYKSIYLLTYLLKGRVGHKKRSFQSKMHQEQSGGGALPVPAEGAWALPQTP